MELKEKQYYLRKDCFEQENEIEKTKILLSEQKQRKEVIFEIILVTLRSVATLYK